MRPCQVESGLKVEFLIGGDGQVLQCVQALPDFIVTKGGRAAQP